MTPEDIQAAVKSGNVTIGYRESMKTIKLGGAKAVIVANNIPENMGSEIEHNARIAGSDFEKFDGSSKDLGTVCGKPYPVAVLVIKG